LTQQPHKKFSHKKQLHKSHSYHQTMLPENNTSKHFTFSKTCNIAIEPSSNMFYHQFQDFEFKRVI
jgi:hypothetical protein